MACMPYSTFVICRLVEARLAAIKEAHDTRQKQAETGYRCASRVGSRGSAARHAAQSSAYESAGSACSKTCAVACALAFFARVASATGCSYTQLCMYLPLHMCLGHAALLIISARTL